jgi:hypothetical protein
MICSLPTQTHLIRSANPPDTVRAQGNADNADGGV